MRQCARARGGGREGSDWNVTTKDGWGMGGGGGDRPPLFQFSWITTISVCREREGVQSSLLFLRLLLGSYLYSIHYVHYVQS